MNFASYSPKDGTLNCENAVYPIKSKKIVYYCLFRVLLKPGVKETVYDVYIVYQGSHYAGLLVQNTQL